MDAPRNVIAGQPCAARSGRTLSRDDPATGLPAPPVPDSDASDADAAVDAASRAFPAWSSTPAPERARLLDRLADLIDHNLDALASAESRDTGKPLSLARAVDIPRSAANFRFFASAILHAKGDLHLTDAPPPSQSVGASANALRALNYTLRKPRGVAALISPWNLPLYLLSWKIAPALATGNTVVGKPSELTPSSASLLAHLALDAGIPPGVLNILHGSGTSAGAALVTHPLTPTISFTGSTPVGRWIASHAGDHLKRVSLELGGKNPFIIFDDADLPAAIDSAARAAFTNQGQICLCGARLLVHRKAFHHVRDAISRIASSLRVGDPLDPSTQQGALISRAHLEKVSRLVNHARDLGASVHAGGTPVPADHLPPRCRGGFFFQPTVLSGLDPACPVEQEEIFGPVVTLQPFDSDDHAVALANGTPFGLAATLFTRDLRRAHLLAARLDHGLVWINCWMVRDLRSPFGGAKASGIGREGGDDALRFFTEPSNICLRLD